MTKYRELELVSNTYFDSITLYELKKFLPNEVINNLQKHEGRLYIGPFSDDKKIDVVYLDDVFHLIIENGWRYVNTYWKGGETRSSHKVLTFIKVQ